MEEPNKKRKLEETVPNFIIRFSIGDTTYSTTHRTLIRNEPENLIITTYNLSKEGKIGVTKDEEGNIFFDRSSDNFKPLLEYLRSGTPPELTHDIIQEIEFYGFTNLMAVISARSKMGTDGMNPEVLDCMSTSNLKMELESSAYKVKIYVREDFGMTNKMYGYVNLANWRVIMCKQSAWERMETSYKGEIVRLSGQGGTMSRNAYVQLGNGSPIPVFIGKPRWGRIVSVVSQINETIKR